MKKFLLILAMMLAAVSAPAQYSSHRSGHHQSVHQSQRRSSRHSGRAMKKDKGHRHELHKKGRHIRKNPEIYCDRDWQELWNGCHVRISLDRISILTQSGDRLIWADEVILLPSGLYKTRNGNFWYICSPTGERIDNLWGEFIEAMPNGIFRCHRAGIDLYYDAWGNERR